jgi:hypothetical protein
MLHLCYLKLGDRKHNTDEMSVITALRLEGLHKDNFIDPLARQLKTFYDKSFKVFTATTDDFSHSRQNLPRKNLSADN